MHLDIYKIKFTLFINLIKKFDYEIFTIFIINIKKILKSKQYTNFVKKISKKYYEYLNVFF